MIDIPGMSPTREVKETEDGGAVVTVTPPKFMGLPPQSVTLSKYDYDMYKLWQSGHYIQEVLGHIPRHQREILMSGIGPEDWDRMFKEEE